VPPEILNRLDFLSVRWVPCLAGLHSDTDVCVALLAPPLKPIDTVRPLIAVSPGSALRLFASVLPDFVAEVRNLIREFGTRFFTASRCDQQTDAHADPDSDQQSNGFAEYL